MTRLVARLGPVGFYLDEASDKESDMLELLSNAQLERLAARHPNQMDEAEYLRWRNRYEAGLPNEHGVSGVLDEGSYGALRQAERAALLDETEKRS